MLIITHDTNGRSETWHSCQIEVKTFDDKWLRLNEMVSIAPGKLWKDVISQLAEAKKMNSWSKARPDRLRLIDHLS